MLRTLILLSLSCGVFGQITGQCPPRSCLNQCEYGFDNDISGCPVCNCRLNPALAPANSYRLGTCSPIYSTGQFGACQSTCESDQQCNINQKCCSNGFCNSCQSVSSTRPVTGILRPGVCPVIPQGQVGTCANECNVDTDCIYQNQKCCSNGCGRSCTYVGGVTVATTKPGICPAVNPNQIGNCVSQCNTDNDCQGSLKCCSNGCGRMCTNVLSTSGVGLPTYPGYPVYPYPQYPGYPFPSYPASGFPNTGFPNTGFPGSTYPVSGYPIADGYPYPATYPYPSYPYPVSGYPYQPRQLGPRYSPVIPNLAFYPRFAAVEEGEEGGENTEGEFNEEQANEETNNDGDTHAE